MSFVKSASKSWSDRPCGCSLCGCSFIRLTTLMTRIFNAGKMLAKEIHGGQRFQRRHVAAAGHHDVRFASLVVAGPFPDADARRAMFDRLVHRQPLRSRLFAGDDDVDIVAAAQTVIGDRQERVRVRRQIDAHDLGFLVHDVIDEPGVLVAESVVILPPDVGATRDN